MAEVLTPMPEVKAPVQSPAPESPARPVPKTKAIALKLRVRTLLAIPVAALIALGVHYCVSKKELAPETHLYFLFLDGVLGLSLLIGVMQLFSSHLRRWMAHM